jgi:hypothetical protein
VKRFLILCGLSFLIFHPSSSWCEEPLALAEKFKPGCEYHVSSRVELSGTLTLPAEKGKPAPKPLALTGGSAIEYDERVLTLGKDNEVQKTARLYRRIDFERKVGDQPQKNTIRSDVRRLIILRNNNVEVPFSPDGPLMWSEIDLVRTDVFTPALASMLPGKSVAVGDRWAAGLPAVLELTDLEKIEEGKVECRFEEIVTVEKRRYARIGFSGSVRGVNEDGPNRQQLDGYFFFDLEDNFLSYLSLQGVSSLLDKDGKETGRIEGRFVLTRQGKPCKDLSDEALKGVALEPTPENTQLLYDNPDLGIRFLHPRRWRLAGVQGVQVALEEPNGSGLLITVDPLARIPSAAQFLKESTDFLVQQKAKIHRIDSPQRLQASPEIDHFAIDSEVGGQRVLMYYLIARQARGGATLAARLLAADQIALQKEIGAIARSVTITRTMEGKR